MEGQDENRMSPEHQFFRALENSSFGTFDIDFEQRWIGQRSFFKKLDRGGWTALRSHPPPAKFAR